MISQKRLTFGRFMGVTKIVPPCALAISAALAMSFTLKYVPQCVGMSG